MALFSEKLFHPSLNPASLLNTEDGDTFKLFQNHSRKLSGNILFSRSEMSLEKRVMKFMIPNLTESSPFDILEHHHCNSWKSLRVWETTLICCCGDSRNGETTSRIRYSVIVTCIWHVHVTVVLSQYRCILVASQSVKYYITLLHNTLKRMKGIKGASRVYIFSWRKVSNEFWRGIFDTNETNKTRIGLL